MTISASLSPGKSPGPRAPKWILALVACALIAVLAVPVSGFFGVTAKQGVVSEAQLGGAPAERASSGDAGVSGQASPVVLIGFSGLPWDAINEATTPNLYEFARGAAVANLVAKTLGVTTCPNSAWLTLGTGKRTQESLNTAKLPCQLPPEIEGSGVALSSNSESAAGGNGKAQIPAATWDSWLAANETNGYYPTFGAMAAELESSQVPVTAIGSGAAVAAARADGTVLGSYIPLSYEAGIATNAAQALRAASIADPAAAAEPDSAAGPARSEPAAPAGLTLIDLGSARAAGWELGGEKGVQKGRISAAFGVPDLAFQAPVDQAAAIDAQFGAVLAELPDSALVIAASLAEADSTTAQLQYFAMREPLGDAGTVVRSEGAAQRAAASFAVTNSTRHVGLVQTTDITATILELAAGSPEGEGLDSEVFVGSTIRAGKDAEAAAAGSDGGAAQAAEAASAAARIAALSELNRRAVLTRAALGSFLIAFGVVALLYGSWCSLTYGLLKRRVRYPRALAMIGLSIAAVPAAALLTAFTGWWRVPQSGLLAAPVWAFFGVLVLIAAALGAGCALAGESWHRRHAPSATPAYFTAAALLAGITAAIFVLDAATGSQLHYVSVLGAQQPQDGARFYGFGNTAHITLALACNFLAAAAAQRYLHSGAPRARLWAMLSVAGIGAADLTANAASAIGADFGGTIGIVVGFGLLALLVLRGRVKAWQFVAIVVAGVTAAAAVAIGDWLRPPEARTHVGDFVQSVLDGQLGQVISRKMELFAAAGSPLVWALTILPIIVLLFGSRLAIRGSHADPAPGALLAATAMSAGAIAGIVLTLISLTINDSGPLLPFLAAAFAIPLWLAASVPERAKY